MALSSLNNHSSLTDRIIEQVVGLIVSESMKPGDRLPTERELMARLSVGRSSLREAIQVLRALGIVEVEAGVGTCVGHGDMSLVTMPLAWGLLLSEANARQVVEARRLIEVELAGLAAERATPEEVEDLGRRVKDMLEARAQRSTYVELDLLFHSAIAQMAKNEILANVLTVLQHADRAWMANILLATRDTQRSTASHARVYDAIRSHDAQASRRAMLEHLEGTRIMEIAATGDPGL